MAFRRTRGILRAGITVLTASSLLLGLGAIPSAAAGIAIGTHGATVAPRYQGKVSGRAVAGQLVRATHHLGALARPSGLRVSSTARTPSAVTTSKVPRIAAPAPPLLSKHTFDGVAQSWVGIEPPDPWVAVNGSYVIGSANGAVAVYNRAGTLVADLPTWALFAMDGFVDSDPRIGWDPTHGRWVGVEVGFDDPTFVDTFLSIIVSDTADPLGSWSVYQYGYGSDLPDYPGIASSSDKIVLTVNEFTNGKDFLQTSYLVLPWASILQGLPVTAHYEHLTPAGAGSGDFGLRPARPMAATSDLWLVYENDTTGTLHTFRVSGTGSSAIPQGDTDLLHANGPVLAHAPRQPGDPNGIAAGDGTNPVDGRVPDAVWLNGTVVLARTTNWSWDTLNTDLAVEVLSFSTANPQGTVDSHVFGGPTGIDAFMPGIGMSRDGSRFLTYSSSSDTAYPSIVATAMPIGYGWLDSPVTVATSDSSYTGTRWGDFAGVAPDPLGSSTVWQEHEVSVGGQWQTVVSRLMVDGTAPVQTGVARQSLITGSTVAGLTLPVRVSWPGASDPGSGVADYWVYETSGGSGSFYVGSSHGTTLPRHHFWTYAGGPTVPYAYVVAAQDDADNGGVGVASAAAAAIVYDQDQSGYTWGPGWRTSGTSAAYLGGKARYTSRVGATVSFRTPHIQAIGLVSYRSSTRGKARVYVDGVNRGVITFKSSTVRARNLVWTGTFSSGATHTIKLVVISGQVDVDAFVVLR